MAKTKHKRQGMHASTSQVTAGVVAALLLATAAVGFRVAPPAPVPAEASAAMGRALRSNETERHEPMRVEKSVKQAKPQSRSQLLSQLAHLLAAEVGISPHWAFALWMVENSGKMTMDVSSAGCIGPSQLCPAAAKEAGVNRHELVGNLKGGLIYLNKQFARFGNDPDLAFMAFNWGPTSVANWLKNGRQWSSVPKETRDYLVKVKRFAAESRRIASPQTTQLASN